MTANDNQSHVVNAPFEAYEGDEPYIFISYKHADWKIVYPVIKKLHDKGFNIWYDASLEKGKYYDIQIADHIINSKLFITFISEEVIKCSRDEEDYLIKELSVANDAKIERLPIFLEDVKLSGFYLMHYLGKQSIFKHDYGDNEDMFIDACIAAFKSFGLEPNSSQNNQSRPLPAYNGDEPHIFVSYAHRDANEVFHDIKQFQDQGYKVWYDEGLLAGLDWREMEEKALMSCSCLVFFVSNNSVQSRNVIQEVEIAWMNNIPVIPIYIEEAFLSPELSLRLSRVQSIAKFQMSEEQYMDMCTEFFENCGL